MKGNSVESQAPAKRSTHTDSNISGTASRNALGIYRGAHDERCGRPDRVRALSPFLLTRRDLCDGCDVLDVASGEGYGAALLAGVARSVIGVEIDAAVVAHAQANYRMRNLRFLHGDALQMPVADSWSTLWFHSKPLSMSATTRASSAR